jgi:hypothetical protein
LTVLQDAHKSLTAAVQQSKRTRAGAYATTLTLLTTFAPLTTALPAL